jgi:hypothetical protein
MKRCLCTKGAKEGENIVCRSCWKALPSELRDSWYSAMTKPGRLMAARNILAWVFKNRRTA